MATLHPVRQVPLIIEPDPDDPDFAAVLVEATVAGRPYRMFLDTGAAHSQLAADEYTLSLSPVHEDSSSAAFGGQVTEPVVTITDLVAGPLRIPALDVTRSEGGQGNLLGMDVLGRHRCHFRLAAGVLDLETPGGEAGHELLIGGRGHPYVEVNWPGVSGVACWDTGAGATVVNRDFWLGHPGLFEPIGTSAGTDAHGEQAETPLLLIHGEQDNDVHITQAEEMYMALKRRGVETVLVRYPREGHGLREPQHRVDALERTLAWFDRFLK